MPVYTIPVNNGWGVECIHCEAQSLASAVEYAKKYGTPLVNPYPEKTTKEAATTSKTITPPNAKQEVSPREFPYWILYVITFLLIAVPIYMMVSGLPWCVRSMGVIC